MGGGAETARNWEVQPSTANRAQVPCKAVPEPPPGPPDAEEAARCGFLYLGETKRRPGDRPAEHPRSARNKQLHLPVANHPNPP
eukprot:g12403.t1